MITFRNLLYSTHEDIQQVLTDGGDELLTKLEEKLQSEHSLIVMQAIYIISSIASG